LLGSTIYLPVYFQAARGYGPTSSGLRILPLAVGLVLMSIMSGGLIARTGIFKNYTQLIIIIIYKYTRCVRYFPDYRDGYYNPWYGVSTIYVLLNFFKIFNFYFILIFYIYFIIIIFCVCPNNNNF
jgi:hypothetical protein